jgi:hypothetical protein
MFAIPSASALVHTNGNLLVIGDVYLFQKGEKTWLTDSFSFTLAGLDYG